MHQQLCGSSSSPASDLVSRPPTFTSTEVQFSTITSIKALPEADYDSSGGQAARLAAAFQASFSLAGGEGCQTDYSLLKGIIQQILRGVNNKLK